MLCLTLSFPALSQNFSTDLISVPRSSVINAMTKYNDCKLELQFSQEKLFAIESIVKLQTEEILNLNTIIQNKDQEITTQGEITKLKENQIKALKKEKTTKFWNGVLIGASGGIIVTSIIFLL